MPRKHRRVHHPKTNCRCPEGAKRVETKTGRRFSCLAMVLPPNARKPLPRFVKMVCDPEAGQVKQWEPPPGHKRRRKSRSGPRKPGDQLILRYNRPTVPPPSRAEEQLLLNLNRNKNRATNQERTPWWWRQ